MNWIQLNLNNLADIFKLNECNSEEEFEEKKLAMQGFFVARSGTLLDKKQKELGFTSEGRKS